MLPRTLGVIGLGAIGGSVAWRAARLGRQRVVGHAESTRDGVAAVRAGAVTELVRDAVSVARAADLVILATPPKATLQLLRRLAPVLLERGAYCTDVTAVKVPIVRLAEELELGPVFAGSHPFVGSAASGFRAATPERMNAAVVYVTPVGAGDRAADEIGDFWARAVGAHPVTIGADDHDRLLAWTGQLPQAVASALAAAFAGGGPSGVTYGRGAMEMTQLAGDSPEQWADLLLMNREHLLGALDGLSATVEGLRSALAAADRRAVERWLETASSWRRGFEA
jgi:prephenate dehydrogenase